MNFDYWLRYLFGRRSDNDGLEKVIQFKLDFWDTWTCYTSKNLKKKTIKKLNHTSNALSIEYFYLWESCQVKYPRVCLQSGWKMLAKVYPLFHLVIFLFLNGRCASGLPAPASPALGSHWSSSFFLSSHRLLPVHIPQQNRLLLFSSLSQKARHFAGVPHSPFT